MGGLEGALYKKVQELINSGGNGGFSGGGQFITDPRRLPRIINSYSYIYIKQALAVSYNTNTSTFWTYLDYCGAVADFMTTNTYVTVLDVTGAGYIGNMLPPLGTGTTTCVVKITIDGNEYIISNTSTSAMRHVIGATLSGSPDLTGSYNLRGPGAYHDMGFNNASPDEVSNPNNHVTIIRPDQLLAYGFPVLLFNEGIKIEMKVIENRNTVGYLYKCGVTYKLFAS